MCGQIHNEAKYSFRFDADVMEYYLRQLYGKKFDVETEIEPRMWKEVLRIINEATVEGLSQSKATPTLEENFYTKLRQSNEVFAAFKVHSMGNVMAKMLVGDDGKLKPFRQWKEDVKGVSSHYCGRWLQTEYATAVARAHAAADWMEFEKNKDIFPNLRWMPTTSPNPEKTHEVFWKMKLTRPIGDKFWDEHMPGDHWNCKCSLEQTDDPATTLPTDEEMKRDEPQAGLKENPAKTGQLFDKSHPYFPKNCKECNFNKGIKNRLTGWFWNAKKGNCYNCEFFIHKITDNEKTVNDHPNLTIHPNADSREIKSNKRAANAILYSFPNLGIEIREHKTEYEEKNAEYYINGILADRKGIKSPNGIKAAFRAAKEQNCRIVVIDLDENIKILKAKKLATHISWRTNDFELGIECYVVFNNKAVHITSSDKKEILNEIKKLEASP